MTLICHINDINELSSKGFEIKDSNYFVVKKSGRVYLYKSHCPHLGVELNWQQDIFLDDDKQLIRCSTHGALFTINDGHCVFGPCLGKKLQAVPFTLADGNILLTDNH